MINFLNTVQSTIYELLLFKVCCLSYLKPGKEREIESIGCLLVGRDRMQVTMFPQPHVRPDAAKTRLPTHRKPFNFVNTVFSVICQSFELN